MVLGMSTKSKRQRALETLPTNLYDSFRGIITRIRECPNACQADLGFQVLMWLHFARRPLNLKELQHALAIEKGDTEFDADNIPSRRAILGCCLGLVIVDDETLTVRFVHYTLEEYFRGNFQTEFPNGCISITETCLTYINFGALRQYCTDYDSLGNKMHKYIFLGYAAHYWGTYVKECNEGLIELVHAVVDHESEHPPCAIQYLETRLIGWKRVPTGKFSGIHAIAYFGLSENMAYLCKLERHMDLKDDTGRTPLSWAAEYGHEAVVRLLIERNDVGVDVKDTTGRHPSRMRLGKGMRLLCGC